MASLAAHLSSMPSAAPLRTASPAVGTASAPSARIPQKIEGVVDPEAAIEVESVAVNSLVRWVSECHWSALGILRFMQQSVFARAGRRRIKNHTDHQVILKLLKHSTDPLPPPTQAHQSDRQPPPFTALSAKPDAVGILLGLDLEGVMEVEDSVALPSGEIDLSRELHIRYHF